MPKLVYLDIFYVCVGLSNIVSISAISHLRYFLPSFILEWMTLYLKNGSLLSFIQLYPPVFCPTSYLSIGSRLKFGSRASLNIIPPWLLSSCPPVFWQLSLWSVGRCWQFIFILCFPGQGYRLVCYVTKNLTELK